MTSEAPPTAEQERAAVARRIADKMDFTSMRKIDWQVAYDAALAAIEECTEAHARIAEDERLRHDKGDGFDCQPARNAAYRIREAIRNHLKGPTDA